jgi:hypothetical protein
MERPRTCTQSVKINFPHRIFLGSEYTVPLPKLGDVITSVRLVLNLPNQNMLGEQLIERAEFLTHETIIESITGEFLQILNDFSVNLEKRATYQQNLLGPLVTIDIPFSILKKGFHVVTVPDVRIRLAKSTTQDEIFGYLMVDYTLIEDGPSKTFIQTITKNQNIRGVFKGATRVKMDTAFVDPIFHLFFTTKVNGNFVDYIQNVKLITDGQERFNLGKQYLKYVEPIKVMGSIPTNPICYYSFCLDPLEPSGSMNFSRIDTQRFEIELLPNIDTVQLDIWAQSHNFVHFSTSNVVPIFQSHELVLNTSQDQTLSVLQDLPVTLAYGYYANSVSIYYYIESDVVVTPVILSIYPENNNIVYSVGVVTINKIYTDTYITISFMAPGYNNASCAITVQVPISSSSYSFNTTGGLGVESFSQLSSLNVKTDQTVNLFIDGYQRGANIPTAFNGTVFINTNIIDITINYILLADSYGMKNIVTSSVIDYDDSQYIGMMSTRNAYNKNQTVYPVRPLGGCIIKYSPSGTINWLVNLPGTNPLITYLYPDLYTSSQIQQYPSADAIITKVSCNNYMSLLLDDKGVIYYGGSNTYGEDGNEGINPAFMGFYVPKSLVGKNLTIVDISCGKNHAVLLDSNGGIWVTGLNSNGQLGLGDTKARSSYEQVNLISNRFTKVACGDNHTVLLDTSGKVWTTGDNSSGQLGLGDTTQYTTFQLVSGHYTATMISAGKNNSAYIDGEHTLYMTGDNSNGQLGRGGGGYEVSFQYITPYIQQLQCGTDATMLKKTDGTVLLAGGYTGLTSFTDASTLGFAGSTPAQSVSAGRGYQTDFIIDADGSMWVRGRNSGGEAGIGGTSPVPSFTKLTNGIEPVGSASATLSDLVNLPGMVQVSTGYHSISIDINGNIWAVAASSPENTVQMADSIGMPPTNYQIFQRNNIFQQSIQRPTDINVSKIDRFSGRISYSNVLKAGISNNLTNDANGLLYVDSIKNDSVSYSRLVSVSLTGLVTCIPDVPVKVGDFVSFSCLPSGFIQQGYVVSDGFYLSTIPGGSIYTPVSSLSPLPLVVTIGQNIDKGYTYTLDITRNITKFAGPFGTKCFSHVDRFNNYYISYVDSTSGMTTLKYKSFSVTVSNTPCKNCLVEVDFLGNIYFVGDYTSSSVVTGGGAFTPNWSAFGGTFIMKMSQSGKIKWIIQIQNNSGGPQYATITGVVANNYTGTIYISGYINRNVKESTRNTVSTSVSGSTYTISCGSSETGFVSNGIFGFEFIFDPAGNLNPDYTNVPTNDFFQVRNENLIGLHPVNTLLIPEFYPPTYKIWPPFNLVNSTLVTSPDNLTFTSTLSLSSWGTGQYTVKTSTVLDNASTSAGIRCFDYKNYTDWLSAGNAYNYITGNYQTFVNLSGVYGEYVYIKFPVAVKAKYLYVLQNSVQFWALNYTVLGSNDGSNWAVIYVASGDVTVDVVQSLGHNTYTISDSTKLYKGMTVNKTASTITSINYSTNQVTLSSDVAVSSITFNQMPSKLIYLNSIVSYTYYAFSQQRVYYPNGNKSDNGGTRIYSLIYYE